MTAEAANDEMVITLWDIKVSKCDPDGIYWAVTWGPPREKWPVNGRHKPYLYSVIDDGLASTKWGARRAAQAAIKKHIRQSQPNEIIGQWKLSPLRDESKVEDG